MRIYLFSNCLPAEGNNRERKSPRAKLTRPDPPNPLRNPSYTVRTTRTARRLPTGAGALLLLVALAKSNTSRIHRPVDPQSEREMHPQSTCSPLPRSPARPTRDLDPLAIIRETGFKHERARYIDLSAARTVSYCIKVRSSAACPLSQRTYVQQHLFALTGWVGGWVATVCFRVRCRGDREAAV